MLNKTIDGVVEAFLVKNKVRINWKRSLTIFLAIELLDGTKCKVDLFWESTVNALFQLLDKFIKFGDSDVVGRFLDGHFFTFVEN
jgi:hypothetical protein